VFGGGRESTYRRSLSHRQVHPAHLRPQEAPPVAPAPVGRSRRASASVFGGKLGDFARPPAVQCVFICCLSSWAPFSVWLGRCPTCVRPPGASPECSVRRAAEEASSEARQQRTLLVTPWIPSSFRSITFFLGASSYHEQQRRLSLRQQRRPPSEGAGAALRAFSAPPKREKFSVREKFTLACSAAPRCTSLGHVCGTA
jgi:hypothetical protein